MDRFNRLTMWLFNNGIALILVLLLAYTNSTFHIGLVCPLNNMFGIDCPGCGGTRMLVAILHGQFTKAMNYNAFLFVTAIPALMCYLVESIYWINTGRIYKETTILKWVWLISFFIFGVLRNLPQFSFLAVHD